MLALRRSRLAASPAFLRGGFRPFFLGGAIWAAAALAIWLCSLAGVVTLLSHFDPLSWHRHEMLFGFVGAVIAGFLLTAIPNWTGRPPIAGPPLAALFGLWVAARLVLLFSQLTGPAFPALLDVGFYLVLAGLAAREVLAAKNRNFPIVLLLLLFGAANAADHAGAAGLIADVDVGVRAAISIVVLMISLIGGRIVPSFTRNWLARNGIKEGLPDQPGRLDLVVIAATAGSLLAWVALPPSRVTGALLIAASLLQIVRLGRWRGLRARRDPLVFILHVGYFWVPAGLLLLGMSLLGTAVPTSAAIHALTAGAMATMIIAVMTRATLGHTGRELKANRPTILLYALITAGAALRVSAPMGMIDYMLGMRLSAIAWGGAFLGFVLVYGPILLSPRADEPC